MVPGEARRRRPWRDVACAGFVVLLAFAIWELRIVAPIALPQDVGRPNGDLYTIYYPLYTFAYRGPELVPSWNPYQMAGTPTVGYLAGGLYYPPNFVSVVVPVHRALGLLLALHLALAGVGTWALARRLGLSRPAATVAAVTFLSTPSLVSEHLRPMYLFGLAWIPLVALLGGRLVVEPTARNAAFLGIAAAMQLLTGHVQIVCYEIYVGLGVAVPAWILLGRSRGWRHAADVAVAGTLVAVIVALLAAAQILPTMEVVTQAVRDLGGLTVEQTLPMRPSWGLLRGTLAAIGLALVFVPSAVLAAKRRLPIVAVCCVLALVTGAIGLGTEAYDRVFFRLPGVALFRLPQQILAIEALALTILAAVGVDAITRGRRLGVKLIAVVTVGVVAARFRTELGPPAGLAVAAAALAAAMLRSLRGRRIVAWTIAAIVVGERVVHTHNTVMIPAANDDAFFAKPAFVGFLEQHLGFDRVTVVKAWNRRFPVMEKIGSQYGFSVVQDYEPLTPVAYHRFVVQLDAMNTDRPLFWGRYIPFHTGIGWRPLDLLSTRYVVVAPGADWAAAPNRFRPVYDGADAVIYENEAALPRATVVGRHRVIADDKQALRTVMSPAFDPRAEVILDRLPASAPAPAEQAAGIAAIVARTHTTLTVRSIALAPAFLVVNDFYWPGWTASVDGEPVEVLRANYLFRAVAVPAGDHVVTFSYRSDAIRRGLWLSVVGVVVTLVAVSRRSPRRTSARARSTGSP